MSGFCTPAFIYFVVSALSVLGSLSMGGSGMTVAMSFLWVVLFSYLLNWLCSKGYKNVSWVIVMLPLMLSLILLFMQIALNVKNSSPGPSPSP
jgi:hypothetical protein